MLALAMEFHVLLSDVDQTGACTYGAPSVAAWAAVAIAVTSPKLRELPISSQRNRRLINTRFQPSPLPPVIPPSVLGSPALSPSLSE